MAKSPGTNSPVSSTKKQRSASPSNATPRSAPSSSVLRDDELPVLRQERVRLVVREGAVGLEVAAHGVDSAAARAPAAASCPPSRWRRRSTTRSGRIAAGSTNESTRSTKPGQMSSSRTSPRRVARAEPAQRAVADVQQPRLAADRQRAAPDDLHARVLLRVVRGGDADAAVEPELADREVDHLRADHPEVEDVRAAVGGALDHRPRHRGRRHAHVAADGDPARLELLHVGPPDRVRALLVELAPVDAAHVVRLEDGRIEHRRDASGRRGLVRLKAGRRRGCSTA